MKIVFDLKQMRPACPILQAAMGGSRNFSETFNSEDWLIYPTPDMKLYEVTENQLGQLVQKVENRK